MEGDVKVRRNVDPVVTEIVRNGVMAVTEEMKTNLMRTAYNTIIYEAPDFTTGLFTPDGRTVSIGLGLVYVWLGILLAVASGRVPVSFFIATLSFLVYLPVRLISPLGREAG